jgi:protein-S-isoprenylcysteine O-methyltransferase Ste14
MSYPELIRPFFASPAVAVLWIVNLVLVGAVLVSFAWGSYSFLRFARVRELRKLLMAVSVYSWLAVYCVVIVLAPQQTVWLLAVGTGLLALSLYFFWGAVVAYRNRRPAFAFIKTTPDSFVSRGPYRLVRHPIYTSYLLAFLGGACLSTKPLLLISIVWLGSFYYVAAREEERSFQDSPFAEDYGVYRRATGMFLPRLRTLVFPFRRSDTLSNRAG